MNYNSILRSAFDVAASLGYHPTEPSSLHRTLHNEGFPIAVIAPLRATSIPFESGAPSACRMSVKFLTQNVLDDEERAAAISTLATHAEEFCARLSSEPNIFSVELREIAPIGEVLTIAGEVAVEMSADVKSFEY